MRRLLFAFALIALSFAPAFTSSGCAVFMNYNGPDPAARHPRFKEFVDRLHAIEKMQGDNRRFLREARAATAEARRVLGNRTAVVGFLENLVGLALSSAGDPRAALEHYFEALKILESRFGPLNVNVASLHSNIGQVYVQMGEYAEAKEHLEKARGVQRIFLSVSDPSHGLVLHHLGENERKAGHHEKARELFTEALELETRYRGAMHNNTAILRNKLGFVETSLGKYEIAVKHFIAELKILRAMKPVPWVRVAESMHSMSITFFSARRFKDAAKLAQGALILMERHAPNNAVRIRVFNSSLGTMYRETEEYPLALKHASTGFRMAKKLFASTHPHTIESLRVLSRARYYMGLKRAALIGFKTALENAKELHGKNNPGLASYHRELAWVQTDMFLFEAARSELKRAVVLARESKNVHLQMEVFDGLGQLALAKHEFHIGVKHYQRVLELEKETGGVNLVFRYSNLATAKSGNGEYREAVRICRKALDLKPSPEVKQVLNTTLGGSLLELGRYVEAERALKKSLAFLRKKHGGEHVSMRDAWNGLGRLHHQRGEYARAVNFFRKILKLSAKQAATYREEISVRNLLGLSLSDKGDFRAAKLVLESALSLALKRHGDDSPKVAMCYGNLGNVLTHRAEYKRAEEYFDRALRIYEKRPGQTHPDQAVLISNLGLIAGRKGDLKRSIELYNRAVAIDIKILGKKHKRLAITYNNLGTSYMSMDDTANAEKNFIKALKVAEAVHKSGHPMIALILENTGRLLEAQDKHKQAGEHYVRALRINRRTLGENHPAVARNYYSVARLLAGAGKFDEAETLCLRAIKIFRDSLVRGEHVFALYDLALMNRSIGRNPQAVEYLRRAVDRILRYRLELGRTRSGFTERYFRVFELLIDMELALGNTEQAFRVNMRKQGLTLVEGVSERYALARGGVPNSLRREFVRRKARVTALADRIKVLERGGKARRAYESLAELHKGERRLSKLQNKLLDSYPRYAALRRPEPPRPRDLRRLLRRDETIVSYSVSGALPTAFVLGRTGSIRAVTLSVRGRDLKLKARNLHALCRTRIDAGNFRRIILKGGRELVWNTALEKSRYRISGSNVFEAPPLRPGTQGKSHFMEKTVAVGRLGDFLTRNEAEELREKLRRELYDILLKPVEKTRGLILIPDGSLHYVPFGILLDGAGRTAGSRFRIRAAPSANVWYDLRRARAPRSRLRLLAVGDAVYSAAGKTTGKDAIARSAGKGRAIRSLEKITFANLPGTAGEIKEITRIAYGVPGKHALLGVKANRDLLMKYNRQGRLARYRILHFAVHGLFVEGNADLNALVLSDPAQARELKEPYARYRREHGPIKGEPYLRLGEVKALRLDARLVVLSACETSLGTEVSGEGMMGLPQAFLMAGSRSVIASLWAVDDKATSELMRELYRNILKRGMHPERALRAAQAHMRKKYEDPYYWAAFVYYGN